MRIFALPRAEDDLVSVALRLDQEIGGLFCEFRAKLVVCPPSVRASAAHPALGRRSKNSLLAHGFEQTWQMNPFCSCLCVAKHFSLHTTSPSLLLNFFEHALHSVMARLPAMNLSTQSHTSGSISAIVGSEKSGSRS